MYMRPGKDVTIETAVNDALRTIADAGLAFPLVAKPDKGQHGAGVQKLRSEDNLRAYLESFPPGLEVVFQALADFPHEAGVMYYRYPGTDVAAIMSITIKEFPHVIGDGTRTLRELILVDPRARILQHIYSRRHSAQLDRVLSDGERFRLVFAATTRRVQSSKTAHTSPRRSFSRECMRLHLRCPILFWALRYPVQRP